MDKWFIDSGFHVPKLMLLEVWPLNAFLGGRKDLIVLDVGGNVGLWCQAFMNIFGEAVDQYHAIEPLNGNTEIFRERLADGIVKNEDKITIHRECLGPENGVVNLNFHADVSSVASVVLREIKVGNRTISNDKTVTTKQTSLSTFCHRNNLDKVDLLKIDVEGYEWDILSAPDTIEYCDRLDMIYFEFGQHQGELHQSFRQFWDLLTTRGYFIYRQAVGRNFFGLQYIEQYDKSLENFDSMWMICATKHKHVEERNRPFVIGAYRPPKSSRKFW